MTLRDCHNARDFEAAARRRLPRPLFDYIEGGADDEHTTVINVTGFKRYALSPSYLRDVRKIDLGRKVLGCDLSWPLILSPTGLTRMFHSAGEEGVAIEACRSGVAYSLSTMASTSIERIAQISDGPKIYQLYLLNDDAMNLAALDRCKAAGYDAVCLTVDTIVAGNRERDLRSGLTIPPKLTPSSLLAFAARPAWCADYLRGGSFSLPNVAKADGGATDISTLASFFAQKMERHISWQRVERLIAHWDGPFAIKGIQSPEDAVRAKGSGATAVVVSNHGGRQLDGTPAAIDLVADIVDCTGEQLEVILDGGIRRGSHIVKAIAMGARACMTGRPYVYALGAYGQPGVARLLSLLRGETERVMALLGCSNIDEVGRHHLRLADQLPFFMSQLASGEVPSSRPAWSRR